MFANCEMHPKYSDMNKYNLLGGIFLKKVRERERKIQGGGDRRLWRRMNTRITIYPEALAD